MNIIEKPLSRSTVAECSDLSTNISTLISNSSPDDTFLVNIGHELGNIGSQMKVSIAADRTKANTEAINTSDSKRDGYISALKLFSRAHMTWNNGHAESGKLVYNLIKKHGLAMTEAGLEEQNGLTESLLNDLETAEAKTAVEAMNITALVADLRAEQTNIIELMLDAAKINSGKEDVIAASTLKKTANSLAIQVCNYLNVMQQANAESYSQLAGQIAELVHKLNTKIRTRRNN